MLLRQPLINRRRQQKPGLAVNWPEVAHRGNILEERSKRALILSGPPHGVKSDRLLVWHRQKRNTGFARLRPMNAVGHSTISPKQAWNQKRPSHRRHDETI